MSNELIGKDATEVVDLLQAEEVTPNDLLDALEARIGEVDRTFDLRPRSRCEPAEEKGEQGHESERVVRHDRTVERQRNRRVVETGTVSPRNWSA